MKIPCTVGILTKNSGKSLERALESVKDFDEIIICDGGSDDDTLEIAKRFDAKIIPQDAHFLGEDGYVLDFSGVRNQTLHAAHNEWYFYIDSDEYASTELVEAIRKKITDRRDGAFFVSRRYLLDGEEITCATTYPNRSMRFFSKASVTGFRKIVHERPALREGVLGEDISGKLLVPIENDRENVRRRNDRYIEMEVRRKGRVGVVRFIGYSWWHLRVSLIYILKLVHNFIFCRGKRMPLSMELDRHWYHLRLMAAIWKARKCVYPPTVLFLINKWKTGGSEHVFLQEFEALRSEGIETLFGSIYAGDTPPGIEKSRFFAPVFASLFDVFAYIRLVRMLGEYNVTHVVSTLEHANIVARIACVLAPWTKIVIIESGMADRKPLRYRMLDLVLNWRTKVVAAGSEGVKESLLTYQSMYAERIKILRNGVSVPTTLPAHEEPKMFTMLAVGSLRKEKAFDVLLAAFALFRKTQKGKLMIAGKGPLEFELKSRAKELGVTEDVEFLGQVSHEEVIPLYRKAHCFVLSSSSEGNPTVVMEAMAQGTPVISTKVSGVGDYIEDGVSGILVPVGSDELLAHAMMKIHDDKRLRKLLSEGGYRAAKEKLSFERHMEVLKSLLGI